MKLYPLKFHPRFVEKMWGGRKIETVLGKTLPAGKRIGESWELFDFPPGVVDGSGEWVSSAIANGPLAGRSLHWAVGELGKQLHGDAPLTSAGQFPILIKFLDAREDLSVQVHPDEEFARKNPGAHLKSEAWYVMENDPGARLFKGVVSGTTQQSFRRAIDRGVVEEHLTVIPTEPGQCFYLPSGTVHALGAGMLVAEVQTPSDTTFRVYDFNRVDPSTGKLRTLHVEQAMQCIEFESESVQEAPASAKPGLLVDCDYFRMNRLQFTSGERKSLASGEPIVWIVLEGEGELSAGGGGEIPTPFRKGETILFPAAIEKPQVKATTDCICLEVTFPVHKA